MFFTGNHSSPEVEQIWKKQWKGDIFFSHGNCHSRGTMILEKDHLDLKLVSTKVDPLGRYILIESNSRFAIHSS